jgi:hypothetical protein
MIMISVRIRLKEKKWMKTDVLVNQIDTDGDGVPDHLDQCPETPEGEEVDENGCAPSQKDSDNDGVTDDLDQCPDTPEGADVDENGCTEEQKIDTDQDGVPDYLDQCPDTPEGARKWMKTGVHHLRKILIMMGLQMIWINALIRLKEKR